MDRMLEKIGFSDSGCWLWLGYKDWNGYGAFKHEGKAKKAHRVVYEEFVGDIPSGLVLDHLCRNTSCVNPEHLEPVTQIENVRRGISIVANNARKTVCKYGHAFDSENTAYKKSGRYCKKCNNYAVQQWKAAHAS